MHSSADISLLLLPKLKFPYGDWVDKAACKGLDPNLFHPERGEISAPAKAVCATCTVKDDCLDFAARNNIRIGIWGGMTEKDRRPVRREMGLLVKPAQISPTQRRALEAQEQMAS